MAAKMAAATRNLKWASRHEEFGLRLKGTVEEIWHVFENDAVNAVNAEAALVVFVGDKLDTMENEALYLVHQCQKKYGVHPCLIFFVPTCAYQLGIRVNSWLISLTFFSLWLILYVFKIPLTRVIRDSISLRLWNFAPLPLSFFCAF